MVDRLPGRTFAFRDPGCRPIHAVVRSVFEQAVDALVAIHQFDWRTRRADCKRPPPLADEVAYWDPILQKAAEPGWITIGEEVRDLLVASLPVDAPVGLFHGDFQTSNLLFDDGVLEAVLDWEISGIGGQRLDIGWLLMMNDPQSWYDTGSFAGGPGLGALEARYEEGMGTTVGDIGWYRALSGYRFGVISGLNVMLHRTGKRHDPEWERSRCRCRSCSGGPAICSRAPNEGGRVSGSAAPLAPLAPWALAGESIVGLARWQGAPPVFPVGLTRMPGPSLVAATRYTDSPVARSSS